jgi:hypothetical protein
LVRIVTVGDTEARDQATFQSRALAAPDMAERLAVSG